MKKNDQTYLITSAAGKTGMYVCKRLLEQGKTVKALVRSLDDRSERLRSWGAEVVVCNMYSVVEMKKALNGCQRAYVCPPTAPNGLFFCNVFHAAAKNSEIEHIVMLSQWLSSEDHPSMFTREVWLSERTLESLDATLTIVNTGWFADNYFMVLESAVQLGMLTMPLGDGNIKNDVAPSTDDIASVVVGSLLYPEKHAGKTYRPTGPELVSPNEIAEAIGKASGVKVKYQNIPESIFLKALRALKPKNYSRAAVTQLKIYAEEYRQGSFAVGGTNNVVREVGEKEPDSIEKIAREMVRLRPEGTRSFKKQIIALKNFMKIVITPKPDVEVWSEELNHVKENEPRYTKKSASWLASHGHTLIEIQARATTRKAIG